MGKTFPQVRLPPPLALAGVRLSSLSWVLRYRLPRLALGILAVLSLSSPLFQCEGHEAQVGLELSLWLRWLASLLTYSVPCWHCRCALCLAGSVLKFPTNTLQAPLNNKIIKVGFLTTACYKSKHFKANIQRRSYRVVSAGHLQWP